MAIELTQEIGRHLTMLTDNTKETTLIFVPAALVHGSPEAECGLLPKCFAH